jgi:hypothetical protein
MAGPDLELKKAFSELQAKMIETKQVPELLFTTTCEIVTYQIYFNPLLSIIKPNNSTSLPHNHNTN